MCRCSSARQEVSDEFRISNEDGLVTLLTIQENLGAIRDYRLTNGNVYRFGARIKYVYAYEGDVEELLTLRLRNKRILEL